MVECEGGQNAFGIATEIQQLDYRLGGGDAARAVPAQCELDGMG